LLLHDAIGSQFGIKPQRGGKKVKKLAPTFSILLLLGALAAPVFAQSGPRGYRGEYQGKYNPQIVTIVTGVVALVEQVAPATGNFYGIHLQLKTDSEELSVHLGPTWFIEGQGMKIEEGDTIEVRGSRIKYEGVPTIIAAQVKKGNSVLRLRNDDGFPVWAGKGRMRRGKESR
jgi:hypothetical protein